VVIRVLDQNYFVLQTLPSETGLLQYVCRNVAENDGHLYRIVNIPLEETTPAMISWLNDIWRAGRFHELRQYAVEKDSLQIVADCGSEAALPLEEILEEEKPGLSERIDMGGKFLQRLILSDVPVFFAINAMDAEHVRFTRSLDCCFTFELEDLKNFASADPTRVYHRIRAVLRKLFSDELRDRKMPELKDLLDRILQLEFSDTMEIYKAWLPIAEQYAGVDEEKLEKQGFFSVLKEKLKKISGFLKKAFTLVILGMAIAYLLFSIKNFTKPTVQKDIYKTIGDMTIISHIESETEESHE